ncbi:MAG: D-alanine--D-alanine ligase [Actinobacteria bacterium]|nr:D-alanine--D-alanine ligase [Actinomycetota bacterium]
MSGAKLDLVVLFGGESAEHDVSCVTAAHVIAAANQTKYEITAIGIARDGSWHRADASPAATRSGRLAPTGPPLTLADISRHNTVVMPLLHGPLGEDGTVQGMLEVADFAYVGAGVLSSALCMDKAMAKQIVAAAGLPQPHFRVVHEPHFESAEIDEVVASVGLPMFVKPANMGSSVGVRKAKTREDALAAVRHAFIFDEWVLCEEAIVGREIEVAVLGNLTAEVSLPGEIIAGAEFYDYDDKYVNTSARLIIPATLDTDQTCIVRELAARVYAELRCEGMARVDFFFEEKGRGFLLNEVNTIPGFTPISMYPKMWAASGLPYDGLIDRLVELALDRRSRSKRGAQERK